MQEDLSNDDYPENQDEEIVRINVCAAAYAGR
jgi:hypothetical protein